MESSSSSHDPSPAEAAPSTSRSDFGMGRRWMLWITLAVAAWGLFHAIGAYLLNHNPWRAVVVMSAVGLFLAFWWVLLTRAPQGRGRQPRG